MKDNKKNDGFKSSVAIICVLSVFAALCCGYLTLSHFKPEVRDNVKEAFTFLYNDESSSGDTTGGNTEKSTARLMCAGENLIYEAIYSEAKERAESGYDFSYVYKNIKDIIGEADLAMINQATAISDSGKPSSYPSFRSPTAVGDALYDAGFRVINQASRNIWDKGSDGAKDTVDYWKTKSGVLLTGLYENEEDMNSVKVKEVNGIKFAFIAFTEKLNAVSASSADSMVIALDQKDKSQVDIYNQLKDMIKSAKNSADVVVVSVSFSGSEETEEPTSDQTNCVNYIASFGADVIIGTGTHTVQPLELRDNGDGSKTVIAHSLGNFMSAQTDKENMLGSIADIIYSKDPESGKVTLESAKLIPTVTMVESGGKNYCVKPLNDLTQEDGDQHAVKGFTYDFANDYFERVIGAENLEKTVMDVEDLMNSSASGDTSATVGDTAQNSSASDPSQSADS